MDTLNLRSLSLGSLSQMRKKQNPPSPSHSRHSAIDNSSSSHNYSSTNNSGSSSRGAGRRMRSGFGLSKRGVGCIAACAVITVLYVWVGSREAAWATRKGFLVVGKTLMPAMNKGNINVTIIENLDDGEDENNGNDAREEKEKEKEKEKEVTLPPKIDVEQNKMYDEETEHIRSISLGVRVHKNYIDKAKFVFEADAVEMFPKDSWWFEDVPEKRIREYLLEHEVLSSMRHPNGSSMNPACDIMKFCCLSAVFKYPEKLKKRPEEAGLWNWYHPNSDREPHSLVDSLELIIEQFNKKESSKTRKHARLLVIGDSLSFQTFQGLLCAIQRTLGAKIVEYKTHLLKMPDYKIRGNYSEAFVPTINAQSLIELNSTKHGLSRIHFTFMQVYRDAFANPKNPDMDHFVFKTLCGIPFDGVDVSENHVNVIGKVDVDVILFNFGIHYNAPENDIFLKTLASLFETAAQCQERGIKTIFREPYAQHFRFMYNGEFESVSYSKPWLGVDLPGRKIISKGMCAPLMFGAKEQVNRRYQELNALVGSRMSIVSQDEETICRAKDAKEETRMIDVIPTYAASALFWKSHSRYNDKDCSHYDYSPGFYLPVIDGLYKSLFRASLEPGQCAKIPEKAVFPQGPAGLKRGIEEGHDPDYLPTGQTPRIHAYVMRRDELTISTLLN